MADEIQSPGSELVHVMLMLAGGHQSEIALPSADAPFLRELFDVLIRRSYDRQGGRLFKIPIEDGSAAMYVPSDSIVGVATVPPMQVSSTGLIVKYLLKTELPSTYNSGAQYEQIDNFLPPEEYQLLLDYVLAKESEFVSSTTVGEVDYYRRSRVMYHPGSISEIVTNRIKDVLPNVLVKLGLSPFSLAGIDSQLTASNDGDFYKIHDDNGSEPTAMRQLTFVYYFYREPKAFNEGNLRIYDNKIEQDVWMRADSYKDVEPRNNSIVFFYSGYEHEVLPVSCPSASFADSRFTLNGWIRREN